LYFIRYKAIVCHFTTSNYYYWYMDQPRPTILSVDDQFKAIADASPVMLRIAGTDRQYYYFNAGWLHFTGRKIEEEKGSGWLQNIHPDDLQRYLDAYALAFNKHEAFKVEYRLKRADGSYHWILDTGAPGQTANGKFAGYINTCVDTEELLAASRFRDAVNNTDDLQKEQAMLASIIESSEDVIISKTLEGIITSWNKAAERVFGYKEHETIGKHISIIIPKERMDEEQHIIDQIRNNKGIDHFETIRVTKYGKRIPISLTVSPIRDIHGKVIGASKIARDISRTKESEERLQKYAENMEILNTVGQVIAADLDVQAILQKVTDAVTQLTGASFGAFFHNHVNETGESYLLYTLSGAPREAFEKFGAPRNTKVFELTFGGKGIVRSDDITKDPRYGKNAPHSGMPKGHLPVVSYLAVPVMSKSGTVIGGLFLGHVEAAKFTKEHEQLVAGVAQQAAVALDNAKLYEEIKQLNAKKDEFIGLASHELKTPITSIKGYLQIIERDSSMEDKTKSFVNKALQQINKLSTLISDLLDVSKIQSGKLPFAMGIFDLNALIKDVAEMMEQSNPSHRIEFELAPGKLMVNADQQRIEQVVINLISNAVKYSPKAEKIIIRSSYADGKVRVAVQDFGIGIEQTHLDRIFSRFYRVENLAAHMSGLGIGLYISQEIIHRHEGHLWVSSKPGEGSIFFFELPAAEEKTTE
jgi:PAS domain S-box-containing protein